MLIHKMHKPIGGYLFGFDDFSIVIQDRYIPLIIKYCTENMDEEADVDVKLINYQTSVNGNFPVNDFDNATVEFHFVQKDGTKIILPVMPYMKMVLSDKLEEYTASIKVSWILKIIA